MNLYLSMRTTCLVEEAIDYYLEQMLANHDKVVVRPQTEQTLQVEDQLGVGILVVVVGMTCYTPVTPRGQFV